jgi:hypothetical protein
LNIIADWIWSTGYLRILISGLPISIFKVEFLWRWIIALSMWYQKS